MPEHVANRLDADTRGEQAHGDGVAQAVDVLAAPGDPASRMRRSKMSPSAVRSSGMYGQRARRNSCGAAVSQPQTLLAR